VRTSSAPKRTDWPLGRAIIVRMIRFQRDRSLFDSGFPLLWFVYLAK
jgi:hypothetical protein